VLFSHFSLINSSIAQTRKAVSMIRIEAPRTAILLAAALAASALLGPASVTAKEHGDKKDNPVVARVDGKEIHRADVEAARTRLPERFQQVPTEAVFGMLVSSLVDTKIMSAEARKRGIEKDEDYKAQMRRIRDQVLERMLLTRHLEQVLNDDVINKAYQDLLKEAKDKKEIRARHILVKTEDAAKALIVKLDGGADFAELAKSSSTGPSGKTGGDLGYFTPEMMVPEFSKAAAAMKKGAHSKTPVKSQFGWHVIKLEDRRKAAPPSLEQVRGQLGLELSRKEGSKFIEGLRKNANVERFNLDGTPVEQAKKKDK